MSRFISFDFRDWHHKEIKIVLEIAIIMLKFEVDFKTQRMKGKELRTNCEYYVIIFSSTLNALF